MEVLILTIVFIVGYFLTVGINLAIENSQRKSIYKRHIRELVENYDEEGNPKNYDPHYTRELEEKQGLRVATQCDDTNCIKCYWKARFMQLPLPHPALSTERQEFLDGLPDGLSDELYDSLLEDWQIAMRPLVEARRRKELEAKQVKEREAEEAYYATPYHLIQQYRAEGRVFNKKDNSWSLPKGFAGGPWLTSTPIQWTPKEKKILERNKKHWKKKFEAQHKKPAAVVEPELNVYHEGKWMPLGMYRQKLFGAPPNFVGKAHVIDDFDALMKREAGIKALKSGVAMMRETNQLLLEAKQKEDQDNIRRYQDELKFMSNHIKGLRQQVKEWESRAQRYI